MDDLDLGRTLRGFAAGHKVFGRYTLARLLGRGGMGVVWLARDEELEQEVALKFLPEVVMGDNGAIDDMRRETRRARELTHPNIVRIHDFLRDSRMAAISMEYVAGDSLGNRRLELPARVFEPAELAKWVEQLCGALEYAHTMAKIVHRDLKPANLMVDARGDLKIADFGISATLSDTTTRVSKQAGSSGTPVYMSPQQMMGEKPAATDDIYSLGATLYELLTGKPPFYTGNVLLQVQNKVPPSVAERRAELGITVAGAGDPGIPAAWEETIAACLAKQPQDRPQSASEVWARLSGGAVVGSEERGASRSASVPSTQSIPSTASASAPSPIGTWKSKLPLVIGLAALLAVSSGMGWYYGIEQPAQRRAEILRQEQEREAEQKRQAELARLEAARQEADRARKAAEELATQAARERDEQARLAAEAAAKAERERQSAVAARAEQERLAAAQAAAELARRAAEAERERQAEVAARAEHARLVAVEAAAQAAAEQARRDAAEREQQQQEDAERAALDSTPLGVGQTLTIPDLKLELMPIPTGSFMMGSSNGDSDETPVTHVQITRPFWLGKTEVTQVQWEAVMGRNPSKFSGSERPVENVSYDDAMEFCRKLTARERAAGRLTSGYEYTLPTEAQWEYACRAGTTSDYVGSLDAMGWCQENSGNRTHPVGQQPANAWGLYDMRGNVWEWCRDWYADRLPGVTVRDPVGPSSGVCRIGRGGCWFNSATLCRSAYRYRFGPGERDNSLGFRLALSSVR